MTTPMTARIRAAESPITVGSSHLRLRSLEWGSGDSPATISSVAPPTATAPAVNGRVPSTSADDIPNARCAARASAPAVPYRSPGSLAMPRGTTSALTPGTRPFPALGRRDGQSGGDLTDDRHRPRGRQRALRDQVEKRLALHQAHVDVETAVDLAPVVDRNDVRFLQHRRRLGLALEPGPKRVVGSELFGE